jgi:glycosyltransferase involved in cell wall biosynthesis
METPNQPRDKSRTISIIVPTYNSARTLRKCLESVRNQSHQDYEIIVVDNESADNTLKIAEEFGSRIIVNKSGQSPAQNIGALNSKGKYILFLDSDQTLEKELLGECVNACEKEGREVVKIREVFHGESFWGSCSAFEKNCKIQSDETGIGVARFFLKSHVIKAGLYDEDLVWGQDREFYERIKALHPKETWSKNCIFHLEPSKLSKITAKYFRYGKSARLFYERMKGRPKTYGSTSRNLSVVLREMFGEFRKSPLIVVGGLLVILIKGGAMGAGFIASFLDQDSRPQRTVSLAVQNTERR